MKTSIENPSIIDTNNNGIVSNGNGNGNGQEKGKRNFMAHFLSRKNKTNSNGNNSNDMNKLNISHTNLNGNGNLSQPIQVLANNSTGNLNGLLNQMHDNNLHNSSNHLLNSNDIYSLSVKVGNKSFPSSANSSPPILSKSSSHHHQNGKQSEFNGGDSSTTNLNHHIINDSPLSSTSNSPLSESSELFHHRSSSNTNQNNYNIHKSPPSIHVNINNNNNNITTPPVSPYPNQVNIISKPSTESTWDINPYTDIEGIKQSAMKDIEFILHQLSDHQRTLSERTKPTYQLDDRVELEQFEKKFKLRHDIAVMLEIIKQFNIGFDMIDMDMEFDNPALGGDEMERRTFLLAKKILYLKMEINKSSGLKRTNILNTIISCIAKFLSTGVIPSEVPSIPIEMTITMGNGGGLHQKLSNTIYKKGMLNKKKDRSLGAKFSSKWVALSHSELFIYSSEKEDQLQHRKSLNELSSVTVTPKEGYPHCFTITFNDSSNTSSSDLSVSNEDWNNNNGNKSVNILNGASSSMSSLSSINNSSNGNLQQQLKKCKTVVFSCESNEELMEWVLAIDGIQHSNFKSIMDLAVKEQLLSQYKSNYKGGTFRFGDEEWHYSDGKLTNESWGDVLEYWWDGYTLAPAPHSQLSLGRGRWNGVWLTWYSDASKDPFLKYLYQPLQRSYIVDSYPLRQQFTWTWSRHFLVSASGGEWICEGEVPQCLVMLVQMMKYYRVGR